MRNVYRERREQINERFKELFQMLNYIRRLNEELYKIKRIKKDLKFAYLNGEINEDVYNKEMSMISRKELELESNILILLGRIKEAIRLLVADFYKGGLEGVEEGRRALSVIKEAISNINIGYYPKYEKEILEIEKELGKVEELELDKKVKPLIEEFEKNKKKEKVIIPKRKILIKYSKEKLKINIFDVLVKISDMIFGSFSNELLDRFPNLYYDLRVYIRRIGLNLTPKLFLSFLLFSITIVFAIGLIISLFIFKIWAVVFSLLLVISTLFLIFLYFEYLKNVRKNNIDNNLPFATIHMLSLLQTGISLEKVF